MFLWALFCLFLLCVIMKIGQKKDKKPGRSEEIAGIGFFLSTNNDLNESGTEEVEFDGM